MAASFTIAARNNGSARPMHATATLASVTAYREAMAEFAGMRDHGHLVRALVRATTCSRITRPCSRVGKGRATGSRRRPREDAAEGVQKAHTRDSLQALSKLAEHVDGRYRIVSQPPLVVPMRDLADTEGTPPRTSKQTIHEQFPATAPPWRTTGDTYWIGSRWVDTARKVVGVGSVGTHAYIVLLQGRDQEDPLFLQLKEATRSVLEDHLPSRPRHRQPRSPARAVHHRRCSR